NIPTYPQTSPTGPDGHDAQWYFQQAYAVAAAATDNPGPFALQDTYYAVNPAQKERDNEIVLYADHAEASDVDRGGSRTSSSGAAPDNSAVWMMPWNHTAVQSAADPDWHRVISSVQREASQHLRRPWTRMAPPIGVIEDTLGDKTNDSRYDGTFTTVYRGNW